MKLNLKSLLSLWLEQNFDTETIRLWNNWYSLTLEMNRHDSGMDRLTIYFGEKAILDEFSRVSVRAAYESLFNEEEINAQRSRKSTNEQSDIFDFDVFKAPEPESRIIWEFSLRVNYLENSGLEEYENSANLEINLDDYQSYSLFFSRWNVVPHSPNETLIHRDNIDDNGHIHISDWNPVDDRDYYPDYKEERFEFGLDFEKLTKRTEGWLTDYDYGRTILELISKKRSLLRDKNRLQRETEALIQKVENELSGAITDEEKLEIWRKTES